jgi:4-hydroxythreonine-4-phosphate dehydrogenase
VRRRFVVEACARARSGQVDGIATAPLNKAAMHASGHTWPGHTELLAHEFGVRNFSLARRETVLLPSDDARVPERCDRRHYASAPTDPEFAEAFTKALGWANEPIGLAGLNPHAGEGGLFGREELEVLEPAVARARARGLNVRGPLPADALIPAAVRGKWRIVVVCYHDQGHAPFKAVYGDNGVNITVGLPVVRVSVDHGTAFDIAGKGVAREDSLVLACRRAAQLAPGWRLIVSEATA